MKRKNLPHSFNIIIICSIFIISCSDPISSPSDIPIDELLSAPETLSIDNKNIVLNTSIYLDLMPGVSETPMIVQINLETVDSSDIPTSINPKSLYIVNQSEVWKTFFSNESPRESEIKPFRIVKKAREGPKWGPNIFVDIIVSLEISNKIYLIRVSDQYINAVY